MSSSSSLLLAILLFASRTSWCSVSSFSLAANAATSLPRDRVVATFGRTFVSVRGGGAADSDDEPSDDDADDDAVDVEVVRAPWTKAAADRARPMISENEVEGGGSDDVGRYRLVALLYFSLALDVVKNKTKRAAIFFSDSDTVVPTILLANGLFAAAASALSLSLDRGTATTNNDRRRKRRTRLGRGLVTFSLFHVLAQCVPDAPWMGTSAVVIHAHNALVAIGNEGSDSLPSLSLSKILPKPPVRSSLRVAWLATLVSLGRRIPVVLSTLSSTTTTTARDSALAVASLGRATLALGLLSELDGSNADDDAFFVGLRATAAASSVALAIAIAIATAGSSSVARAAALWAFASSSGYEAYVGARRLLRKQRDGRTGTESVVTDVRAE